ncbi:MAG: cytochrome c oxidase accessory protein CcoG [Chromatiales bacterium]|nr:cytochrome c oxidase accessory protein CcoG [Chromatiales bacterium]
MSENTPETTKKSDDPVQVELYEKRKKLYVREVHGIFARARFLAMATLLGLYYGLPWLTWDDRQALLFDLPARKFYIFGFTFWPQDFVYLTSLLIIAAMALFFFTAVAGRLWCGYACPQTVWTEIFMWIERKIEGDRNKAMKLDKAPWTPLKFYLKGAKHTAWFVFALWTGFTFVGYFSPIKELAHNVITWNLGPWETFWIFFYSLATWGNAGFLREQVCIYMCPYARFQSAMFDADTLIISYDEKRGDPRGSRRKSEDPKSKGLGDCVDCGLCTQVCPTGIDIRDGLQYQCIGCAACVDVCDGVMEKMGYDKGLVKYTTLNSMNGKPTHPLRFKVVGYGAMILLVTIGVLTAIVTRTPLNMDILRDRSSLYRETDEGLIENVYTIRIANMDTADHTYTLSVDGIDDLVVELDRAEPTLASGEVTEFTARLAVDPYLIKQRSTEVTFHLVAQDDPGIAVDHTSRFLGPASF